MLVERDQEEGVKKKRKRNHYPPAKSYYVPVHAFPPIIKRDIRREFGRMITNVYNSCDEAMFSRFFNQFCLPDFKYFLTPKGKRTIAERPTELHCLDNVNAVIAYTSKYISLVPDVFLKVQQNQIIRRKDISGCIIQLEHSIRFTELHIDRYFQPTCLQPTTNNDTVSICNCWVCQKCMSIRLLEECQVTPPFSILSEEDSVTSSSTAVSCDQQEDELHHPAKEIVGIIKIRMFLDDSHRLYRMENIYQPIIE